MSVLAFQKPDKILMQKSTDFDGLFEFKPLEPGFGITVGNALRRVLLSSLEGYAITAIKITGVDHEFSTINGVVEDVTEIILNLKKVRFKKVIEDDFNQEKVFIAIKKQEQFKAGDIEKFTNSFKITNPDMVICNMESFVNLEIEMIVDQGRGYVPAEENKPEEAPVGLIPIDAIFSPITKVKYLVENTRVEQKTDFEKLILEVSTDGTIHPEEALKGAARILIQQLVLITDDKIKFDDLDKKDEIVVDEQVLQMRKLLKTPIEDLTLSVRAYNCLRSAKIESLGNLVKYNTTDLLKFRNFGRKSLVEIEALLTEKGLSFGMDLAPYKLNEES
jgi:DNA-directed RNA polymerase subunit alpha